MKSRRFKDETVAVTIKSRKGDIVVDTDEYPKAGVTMDSIAKLHPAFDKEGTVTAANASGINDGAAAVVLMTAGEASKRGASRSPASCPGRTPASIRRSWEPDRSRLRAPRCGRLAGTPTTSTWSRPTKRSRHKLARSTRISAGIPPRST